VLGAATPETCWVVDATVTSPAWQVKPGESRIEGDMNHPIQFLLRSSLPPKPWMGCRPPWVRSRTARFRCGRHPITGCKLEKAPPWRSLWRDHLGNAFVLQIGFLFDKAIAAGPRTLHTDIHRSFARDLES